MTKEKQIQSAIINYLEYLQNQGELYYIRNQSGALKIDDRRFIRFGRRGSADIIVFFKGGVCQFWEIKTNKGRQSQSQKEFENVIKRLGFEYYIVRSLDDAQKIIYRIKYETKRINA